MKINVNAYVREWERVNRSGGRETQSLVTCFRRESGSFSGRVDIYINFEVYCFKLFDQRSRTKISSAGCGIFSEHRVSLLRFYDVAEYRRIFLSLSVTGLVPFPRFCALVPRRHVSPLVSFSQVYLIVPALARTTTPTSLKQFNLPPRQPAGGMARELFR